MKRILIVIDGSENDIDSLTSAKTFAAMTDARLTVAYARVPHHSIMGFGDFVFAGDDSERSAQNEAHAKAAFDQVCGDLTDARFLIYEASGETIISALGHAYDLVLVERLSSEDGPEASNLNAALFETGRPVLLIPPAAGGGIQRIAIAWNGSKEASRAVALALPLLETVESAVVIAGVSDYLTVEEVNELVDSLAWHGVNVTARTFTIADGSVSDRLQAEARAAGADTILLGAYGHSRLREMIFGGVTAGILDRAGMPVLMAH